MEVKNEENNFSSDNFISTLDKHESTNKKEFSTSGTIRGTEFLQGARW